MIGGIEPAGNGMLDERHRPILGEGDDQFARSATQQLLTGRTSTPHWSALAGRYRALSPSAMTRTRSPAAETDGRATPRPGFRGTNHRPPDLCFVRQSFRSAAKRWVGRQSTPTQGYREVNAGKNADVFAAAASWQRQSSSPIGKQRRSAWVP
jgi:hypothetical protein